MEIDGLFTFVCLLYVFMSVSCDREIKDIGVNWLNLYEKFYINNHPQGPVIWKYFDLMIKSLVQVSNCWTNFSILL